MDDMIIVRGGGDLATGVVQKLHRSGFRVVILETECPTAIRRTVALCEAVYKGAVKVEDVFCRLVTTPQQAYECLNNKEVPLLIDPKGIFIKELKPQGLIDAILAKRNLGTSRAMAPVTIGLGPGFIAGEDVDAVIETMRGHDLGRLILNGCALPNTGVPGVINGQSSKRVLHAPRAGKVDLYCEIGSFVKQGEPILSVDGEIVCSPFAGLVRGLIRSGMQVPLGMKIGDIDPRCNVDIHTISDKARCLGGAALEAYLFLRRNSGGAFCEKS